jgi:hypothetical protein
MTATAFFTNLAILRDFAHSHGRMPILPDIICNVIGVQIDYDWYYKILMGYQDGTLGAVLGSYLESIPEWPFSYYMPHRKKFFANLSQLTMFVAENERLPTLEDALPFWPWYAKMCNAYDTGILLPCEVAHLAKLLSGTESGSGTF